MAAAALSQLVADVQGIARPMAPADRFHSAPGGAASGTGKAESSLRRYMQSAPSAPSPPPTEPRVASVDEAGCALVSGCSSFPCADCTEYDDTAYCRETCDWILHNDLRCCQGSCCEPVCQEECIVEHEELGLLPDAMCAPGYHIDCSPCAFCEGISGQPWTGPSHDLLEESGSCETICHACDSMVYMDYGGNPMVVDENGSEVSCGYAPTVLILASDPAFAGFSWYSGGIIIDSTLDSPLACQIHCFETDSCDFFSYEHEVVEGVIMHKCYLKVAFDDSNCAATPYVEWSTDSQVHSESGPGIACESSCHVCADRLGHPNAEEDEPAAGHRCNFVELMVRLNPINVNATQFLALLRKQDDELQTPSVCL
jgi:hypothetical protein